MIKLITLQTDQDLRRSVTIAYTTREAKECRLLGNLEHNTKFRRSDLIKFAQDVLEKLGVKSVADDRMEEEQSFQEQGLCPICGGEPNSVKYTGPHTVWCRCSQCGRDYFREEERNEHYGC